MLLVVVQLSVHSREQSASETSEQPAPLEDVRTAFPINLGEAMSEPGRGSLVKLNANACDACFSSGHSGLGHSCSPVSAQASPEGLGSK